MRLTFDNSPPEGTPGVLLGFLEGRRARQLGRLAPEERRAAVVDTFTRLFGPRRPGRTPTSSGSGPRRSGRAGYGCHLPTGAWTNYGPALREPIGPLHWAGAECAPVWNGYMDGAVRSGERAAAAVLGAL